MANELEVDNAHLATAGLAVSAVAGAAGWLVYLMGDVITDGGINVPAPGGVGTEPLSGGAVFRTGFIAGLVATAVLWLLLMLVPTPTKFFGWLGGLATLAAAIIPFSFNMTTESKVWLSLIDLTIGLVAVSLLVGVVPKVTKPKDPIPGVGDSPA